MSKHSDEFYKNKYQKLKEYARSKNIRNPYRSWRDFKSDYLEVLSTGDKKVMRTMKYNLEYNTDYKTALRAYQAAKEAGEDIKFRDVKKMTTQEFAHDHQDLIMRMYDQKKSEGMKASEAGEFISNYWFGSE